MNNLPIKVFKFTSCPDGYKCNHPGDCSGEYIGVLDYEEMGARAERAEEALKNLRGWTGMLAAQAKDIPPDIAEQILSICKKADSVLSSPPAIANKMGSDQPADAYSGELGNTNLRMLAARMHAALGLLKRQGCYHPGMDSMREEGFRHGLNIGDAGPEDYIADASKMGGEQADMTIQWSEPGTPVIDCTTGETFFVPRERRWEELVRDAFMQGWDAKDSDYPHGALSYSERAEEAWECSTARATLSLEPWGGPDGEEE